jgi:glycosyltransferase involved in cell wall biosynthesis
MRPVLLTQQVGNYHAARYRACAALMPGLQVIAATRAADFPEFLSNGSTPVPVTTLFETRAVYRDAVKCGTAWRAVEARLAALAPDVVGIAGWTASEGLAALSWARRHGKPVVVMSDSQAHDTARGHARETIKRRIVSACDAALVAAEPHRRYVLSLGIPEQCIFLGYDVVDNGHFALGADRARQRAPILRSAHGLPARYLLASARFIPKKNLPALIAAYARACGDLDAPHLVLLGDGPERSAVEAAIREHRLTARVHLPGFRGYDVLPVFYGLAEGFVHVPQTEQWGLVLNEAAATGLPLVASRPCGAASTLVEPGRNGWLVDPASIADMAAAIRALIVAGDDKRASMGRESRRMIADWGLERFAAGLRDACEAALARPARRLLPWDEMLVRVLARRVIENVQ